MAEKDEGVPAAPQNTPPVVTGADVESALRGATFPATTRELLERARQNGAEDYVVERLAELADRRATSLGDVLRHLDMLS
ncbi:MAG TPA: DUF2795 domain-containing protein [bacterium]|nr:DUF2795 domain-containing protein [bacterium]